MVSYTAPLCVLGGLVGEEEEEVYRQLRGGGAQ
jgi:hypothetical protein